MNQNIILKHETCIRILEAIEYFKNLKKLKMQSLKGISGTIYEIRTKYTKDVEIYDKCIKRLQERYQRLLNECSL